MIGSFALYCSALLFSQFDVCVCVCVCVQALKCVVLYLVLAPYDNEQSDLIHRVKEDKLLEKIPKYRYTTASSKVFAFCTVGSFGWYVSTLHVCVCARACVHVHEHIGQTTRNAGKLFPPLPPPTGGNLIRQLGRPALPLPDRFLGHALVLEFLLFHVLWSTVVC